MTHPVFIQQRQDESELQFQEKILKFITSTAQKNSYARLTNVTFYTNVKTGLMSCLLIHEGITDTKVHEEFGPEHTKHIATKLKPNKK